MTSRRLFSAAALVLTGALALTACAVTPNADPTDDAPTAPVEGNEDRFPLTVTDLAGNEVTIESLESVVVTDNRAFQLVADWGIELSAAPRSLMSENNPLKNDESILDLGSHREPDFEQVVAADPDLIINGYRYSGHAEGMQDAAPGVAFVDLTNDELGADAYAIALVTLLGEIFDKEAEADAVIGEFHAAVDEAKAAYDPATTVMGLVTSANEIRYSNPTDGRGASIFFDLVGLTPALDIDGSTNHQGDDISIEEIAQSNADFFLVLDRDAAVSGGEESTPALELIGGSATLATVPAVQNDAIYVMPADYYLTEDIFAYTTVLKGLAAAFAAQ